MKTIVVTNNTFARQSIKKNNLLKSSMFKIPQVGSRVKIENSQKYINKTNIISGWRRGLGRHYNPYFFCLEINNLGIITLSKTL